MNEHNKDIDIERVRKHVDSLREHYDSVQIFVNRGTEDGNGGTVTIHTGGGNWHSRYGQVKEWVIKQEKTMRMEAVEDRGEN